jgi:hypothetical protein
MPFRFCLYFILWSYNPQYAVTYWVWAASISLATTLEITVVFSSYAYLDVSVQHVRAFMHPLFKWIGFPIRKSPDQVIFADPRRLSQLITSFIASESQGIPRVPFLTFFYLYCLLLSIVCFFDSCYVHQFTRSSVHGYYYLFTFNFVNL